MSGSPELSSLALAESLRPRAPVPDDPDAASRVLGEILEASSALHTQLHAVANRHLDAAPTSATHVTALSGALARTVLDWIEQWPS